jgi:hypothetical protein
LASNMSKSSPRRCCSSRRIVDGDDTVLSQSRGGGSSNRTSLSLVLPKAAMVVDERRSYWMDSGDWRVLMNCIVNGISSKSNRRREKMKMDRSLSTCFLVSHFSINSDVWYVPYDDHSESSFISREGSRHRNPGPEFHVAYHT